jgi:hypothetical protein
MSREASMVKAVRAVSQAVVHQQDRWSADAVLVAKAILALTHDANRIKMDSGLVKMMEVGKDGA